MIVHMWRDKILNLEASRMRNEVSYDLGPLKTAVNLRIPCRLGLWLQRREALRQAKREEAEDRLIMRM